jgi:hypothetical protein
MSDTYVENLQNMNDALSNKESFYLTFTSNKSVFTGKLDTPRKLLPNRRYRAALHNFTTSNYQINITEKNNKFYYRYKTEQEWSDNHVITFEKGAYEIRDINDEIVRIMKERKHWDEKEPPFNLTIKLYIFKSIIEIKGDKLSVLFNKPNTLGPLLGFESTVLKKGYNISENTAQITSASLILIKCSITGGSYHNGKASNVLYSFPAYLVPVGYKINIMPSALIYLPVIVSVISNITFEIVDDNNQPLDFKDEKMALAIHVEQV